MVDRRVWLTLLSVGVVSMVPISLASHDHPEAASLTAEPAGVAVNPQAAEEVAYKALFENYAMGVDQDVPAAARSSSFAPDAAMAAGLGLEKQALLTAGWLSVAKQATEASTSKFVAPGLPQAKTLQTIKTTMDVLLADPNYRALGGGADDYRVTKSTLAGRTATVIAEATCWTSFISRHSGGAVGDWRFSRASVAQSVTISLVKVAGKWAVSQILMQRPEDQPATNDPNPSFS